MANFSCLEKLPSVPKISMMELFKNGEEAGKYFDALHKRKAALVKLIEKTQASKYAKNRNSEAKEFIIVSQCTNKKYRLQLTKFDERGAVWDMRADDAEELVREIPDSYDVVEIMEK